MHRQHHQHHHQQQCQVIYRQQQQQQRQQQQHPVVHRQQHHQRQQQRPQPPPTYLVIELTGGLSIGCFSIPSSESRQSTALMTNPYSNAKLTISQKHRQKSIYSSSNCGFYIRYLDTSTKPPNFYGTWDQRNPSFGDMGEKKKSCDSDMGFSHQK